jgi:predicted alpha/beta hydrolase
MKESIVFIPAMDGLRLSATLFTPAANDNGVIVQVNGAEGMRREYYRPYARFLCGLGFHVVTFNYRGIGESQPEDDGRSMTMKDWGEHDVAGIIEWVTREFPRLQLVCVAHGCGGQLLGLARNNARVCGQLAISSSSGYWRHWPFYAWPRLMLRWFFVVPLLARLAGRLPGRYTGGEALPKAVALSWARWCRNPHYISDRQGNALRAHFHTFRGRMRFYVLADDRIYAPLEAVRALLGYYDGADRQLMHLIPADYGIPAVGHLGFFRETMPEKAWRETADWLVDAAFPSALQMVAGGMR